MIGRWPDPDYFLLEQGADDVLLGLLARDNEPPPHYPLAQYLREPAPVEGFDRVAFRRHMRCLIEQREQRRSHKEALRLAHEEARRRQAEVIRQALEAARYDDERRELDRLLAKEAGEAPPKPQPIGASIGTWYVAPQPKQNVEPWFDLSKPLTLSHLRCIAQYTLGYFKAARGMVQFGSPDIGKMTTRVVCPRDADAIATAMMQVKAAIPHQAHLSAALLDLPEGILAVALGCPYVALRLASVEDGKRVSIEVTWNHGTG